MATTWWSIPSRENNLKILDLLISKKADINVQDDQGNTALMMAAITGYWQVINILIQNNVEVDLTNRKGQNVLMVMLNLDYLVVSINTELFGYILSKKIDLNAKDIFGDTALTTLLNNQFVIENDTNAIFVIRTLIRSGADQNLMVPGKRNPNRPCTYDSYNALILSSCLGNTAVAQNLLQFSPQINAVNSAGNTALILATSQNKDAVVALLLQAKAQVDIPEAKTSALIKAVENGNPTIVDMLLKAGANIVRPKNQPLLSLCVNSYKGNYDDEPNYLSVADILIRHGVNIDEVDGNFRETAIYWATSRDSLNFMKLFLTNGASVNAVNNDGKSSVHVVRSLEALKLLLNHGADINMKDNAGNTLLHYIYGWAELTDNVEWILKQGANVDAKNNKGYTPTRVILNKAYYDQDFNFAYKLFSLGADKNAVDNNNVSNLMFLVSKINTKGLKIDDPATKFSIWLIKNNVDLNIQSKNGSSVLHDAIKIDTDEHFLLTELLNSKRLNLNLINKAGDNALLSTLDSNVVKNQAEIDSILMVIGAGIDLNLQNKAGNTALMLNFTFGGDRYPEITKLIVNKGANLNLRNNSGKTALGLAKYYRLSSETIKLLIDNGAIE